MINFDQLKCGCGEGYASHVDGLCRFCRENLLSRSEGKAAGVRHSGDGITLHDYQAYQAKKGYVYPNGAP